MDDVGILDFQLTTSKDQDHVVISKAEYDSWIRARDDYATLQNHLFDHFYDRKQESPFQGFLEHYYELESHRIAER